MVEYSYLESLEDEVRTERYRKLLGFNVPCVIMCRDYEPDEEVLRIAGERGIPILDLRMRHPMARKQSIF